MTKRGYNQGVSSNKIRDKVITYIVLHIAPRVILDLGCGVGAYGMTIKHRDKSIKIVGLDGHLNYLGSYMARSYDVRIHCLIEDYMNELVSVPADLILWMDGPEHFNLDAAVDILRGLDRVIISTPLFDFEQGPVNGNALEEHKSSFTEAYLNGLGYKTLVKERWDDRGEIGAFTKGLAK